MTRRNKYNNEKNDEIDTLVDVALTALSASTMGTL